MALSQVKLGSRLRRAREECGLTQQDAADAIGLSRTSVLQIEAGNRAVSTLELVHLSRLYKVDINVLVSEGDTEEEEHLDVALCRLHPRLKQQPAVREEIRQYLDLFEEGVALARQLGARPRTLPPSYDLGVPTNYSDAVRQGELVAVEERRRLNLGTRPIADAGALLTSQGIWAAAAGLTDEFSGLFLHNEQVGLAILVNEGHKKERQFFSYCHEYAHALIDRIRHPATLTGTHNSAEFVEKRANAFAGAFLMPTDGICELLQQFNRGGSSREAHSLWDVATGAGEHFERRNQPGSQDIGYQDVAYIAHEFMVSYDAALYRVSDMKLINRQRLEELLELRGAGQEFRQLLELEEDEESNKDKVKKREQPLLVRQIGHLAVEAFRRDAISGERFLRICEKLHIRDPHRLLRLARTTGKWK